MKEQKSFLGKTLGFIVPPASGNSTGGDEVNSILNKDILQEMEVTLENQSQVVIQKELQHIQ